MLTAVVLGTILLGVACFAFNRDAALTVKWYGVAVAVAGLAVLEVAAAQAGGADESVRWLSFPFASNYHLGLGGISFAITQMLALVTICALIATRMPRQRDFVAWILILDGAMMGLFLCKDMLLFALFWDLMLVPVFMLMIGWGSSAHAAWRYLIYNVSGGLLLLLATAAFGADYGTTDVIGKSNLAPLADSWAAWIFAGFAIAFLVKTPVWPLHTWMPETYADLPAPVAAVVSAVQSKAGLYGFIVIGLPLFNAQAHAAQPLMFALGFIGLIYGAAVALVQNDAKRIVAYSSLSHLGLILAAIFAFNDLALRGAIVYIIAHGLFSAALFLVIGYVETRNETRLLSRIQGLGRDNPILAGALCIAALAALGLPGLAGFAGELLIMSGLYAAGFPWLAAIALIPIVLAAAYMLRLYQGFMHGPQQADLPPRPDLRPFEIVALAPLVLALVWLGVNPAPVSKLHDNAFAAVRPKLTVSLPAVPAVAAVPEKH